MFKTYSEYRGAWASAGKVDPNVPLNVDIELASICNLRCPFCFYGEAEWNHKMEEKAWDGGPKKRTMPTDMAIRLIDQCARLGVPALKFNWRGESTLHREYSKILQYARRYLNLKEHLKASSDDPDLLGPFHDILVNTNANCRDEAIDGLMAATKCMISLDSTVPETYTAMRVNGRLERAIEVVKELIRRQHPNLWIRRVMTKANASEPFKQRVDEIFGGAGYKVSEHHCMDRGDQFHAVNNPAQYERTYCGYPSQRIMVASDGTCFPCCVDTDGTMPMGNVFHETLDKIWHGEAFTQLRAQLRLNQFRSEICKKCESWLAYKAPQRENVQDKAL